MNKNLLSLGALAMVATASAQSRNSFQDAYITGISATPSGLNLTLTVDANPTLTFMNTTYNVTEVFGIWSLDNDDDMVATATNQNGWNFHSNLAGTGGIAGWKTNPNSGIINSSLSFNYSSLSGTVEDLGYHIRVDGTLPGGGNTAYFTQSVPEPASMIALGMGALALLRRKRR